ncbi:MAG: adenosylcobinamide-GDP ribazoletransferase [Desulfobacteraceae bacterium]|nr:adenosylcobinamide-GDP ribazoletransferase [Desulfobacteraceae bacterium]
MFNHLKATIGFFTIIPVGRNLEFNPKAMTPFFPVVGLLIGAIVAVCDQVFIRIWPSPVASILDIAILALITGALHLDGVADTADGLYGQRPVDRALEIMKDSRVGAMGVVAVVLCLAAKWAGFTAMDAHRPLAILIIPALSRTSAIFGTQFLPYGRPEGGLGKDFFTFRIKPLNYIWALVPVALSMFMGIRGSILILMHLTITFGVLFYYKKKVNCMTGDMLGALIEINEAGMLLVMAAKWGA